MTSIKREDKKILRLHFNSFLSSYQVFKFCLLLKVLYFGDYHFWELDLLIIFFFLL
jgi:hypothetical protein